MSSTDANPVYYELSWAILSTIGLINVLVGIMVMGIAGFSMVSFVPVVVSAAGAVANGMCYYAFYAHYPILNTSVASAFADGMWLVQEAGLSFYSYAILNRMLHDLERRIFLGLFWSLMGVIVIIRMIILATRVRYIGGGSTQADLLSMVDNLHVGYFASIALIEIVSAVFLLRKFNFARRTTMKVAIRHGLFSYLMRSTEIRLAMLAVIGVTRAVTYSFQNTAQAAQGVAGQLDRFAYTLECMFPIIMFIDILASRLASRGDGHNNTSHTQSNKRKSAATGPRKTWKRMEDEEDQYIASKPGMKGSSSTRPGTEDSDYSPQQVFDGRTTPNVLDEDRFGVRTSIHASKGVSANIPLRGITVSRVDDISVSKRP